MKTLFLGIIVLMFSDELKRLKKSGEFYK